MAASNGIQNIRDMGNPSFSAVDYKDILRSRTYRQRSRIQTHFTTTRVPIPRMDNEENTSLLLQILSSYGKVAFLARL